jgi:hypothetical protein
MMAKTTGQLELTYALGVEDGVERFIGTRYHFNDTYRTLTERGTVKVRLYDGTIDNCGDIKRPCLWSAEFMALLRKKMGIYTFACQIRQDPRADATHGFKRVWLRVLDPGRRRGAEQADHPRRGKLEEARGRLHERLGDRARARQEFTTCWRTTATG